ncbi:MAG: glycosyltransferase [Thermodesulfobacteriota bacterium]
MKKRIKVLRIITRLNIGGPSIHVSLLTRGLDPDRFESILVSGSVSDLEGDMRYVPERLGIKPIFIPSLKREIHLPGDLKSLVRLLKLLKRERPHIVHTHTAKAGTLGRIAVFLHNLSHKRKILAIHTFHGHVLQGYFSWTKSKLFMWAERLLASITDAIIAISKSQMRELAGTYGLAPESKFRIVKLGFDLRTFSCLENVRGRFKMDLGVGRDTILIGIVGRLVSIKNHRMFLDAAGIFIKQHPNLDAKFVVVGDGELRNALLSHAKTLGIADQVIFRGWEKDLPRVYADLDILALTSVNEGTPVSIIEAMASRVPVAATNAGGVRDLLGPLSPRNGGTRFHVCRHGILCGQNDAQGLADGIGFLWSETRLREEIVKAAREFVHQHYTEQRLLEDIESVYTELLKDRYPVPIVGDTSIPSLTSPGSLKVLQIYKDYYPPVIGGVEGHINLIANGLKDRGVDVEVLVSNTCARLEIEEIEGIRVTKAPQWGRFASAPLNATFASWVRKLGTQADIVHFHFPNPTGEISSLLARLSNKSVVTYHSDIVRQARMAKLYAPFLREFLSRADLIMATSPNYVRSSEVLGDFQEKCRVIPFGIDPGRFEYTPEIQAAVQSLRRIYGSGIILFIGRFRYYKGLYVLLEAMKRVRGKLLLIGSGPMEKELKHRVAADDELKQKVFFLGELSDQQVVAHLHACDLFVLPSILRSEAFGIVLLEAMACKKPVISTELGTGTSFVNQHQKTGLVVPPNDVRALAEAINVLLRDPVIREQYGAAAGKRVEECFSLDRMIEELMAVYQIVLN